MDVSEKELLNYVIKQGKISMDGVLEDIINMKRNAIIVQHPYKITQGKDGRWRTHISDPDQPEGRKQIARSTRKAIEDYIVTLAREREEERQNKKLTLRSIYPEWFKIKWLDTNNSNTMKHIDLERRKHYLDDSILDVPVKDLTVFQLKNWAREKIIYNQMTKKNYYNMQIIIRQSLDYLVEKEILLTNPFRAFVVNNSLFKPVVSKEPEEEVFSMEEEQAMREIAMKDYESNPTRTSSLATIVNQSLGLRVGELVALKWKDLKDNYLHIRRMEQKCYKQSKEGNWSQYLQVVEHTKTDTGCRKLYVVTTAQAIFALIKKTNKANGYDCNQNDYIFLHNNKRITANSIDWYYEKYCNHLGILKKGNHKVRKTCLTKIADNPNINLKDAMEFAGHKDVKTFIKHYCFSRYNDEYKRNELEKSLATPELQLV